MSAEVASVLDKAADLIDPAKGGRWIRGALTDHAGGYCIEGAMHMADVKDCHYLDALKACVALLREVPHDWNDQDCLDGAEAANVLRKVAEIERAS